MSQFYVYYLCPSFMFDIENKSCFVTCCLEIHLLINQTRDKNDLCIECCVTYQLAVQLINDKIILV